MRSEESIKEKSVFKRYSLKIKHEIYSEMSFSTSSSTCGNVWMGKFLTRVNKYIEIFSMANRAFEKRAVRMDSSQTTILNTSWSRDLCEQG